jgi:hypothetical protein
MVKPISLDILFPIMILFYHALLLHVVLFVLVKEGFFIELESAVLRLSLHLLVLIELLILLILLLKIKKLL